jgi:hypothetical protein
MKTRNCPPNRGSSTQSYYCRLRSSPASEVRDSILEHHDKANEVRGLHGFTVPPGGALFRAGVIDPLFRTPTAPQTQPATMAWFQELDEAALLLALTPQSIPFEAARCLHHDDPDIDSLGQFGISRISPDYEPPRIHVPPPVAADLVTGLLPAFRSLGPADQDRVTLALGRLVKARCQLHPGNRAIDLAIALEVLFMNADRDEHSFKISLRASRLSRR